MPAWFAILAGVSLAGSVLAWIFNYKTKEEQRKQQELIEKIEEVKNKIGNLDLEYTQKRGSSKKCFHSNLK